MITLEEGLQIINQIPNRPFEELFNKEQLSTIRLNKGRTGQLLETVILLLKLSNTHLDFSNGELKTNKCKADGSPDETVAVCQISSLFDNMIDINNYNYTHNYIMDKLANMIYLRADKSDSNPNKWKFLPPIHVSRNNLKYSKWYEKVEEDLRFICNNMKIACEKGEQISSTRGSGHYIQIRTKDSKPYHGIYSQTYKRFVSDKNYAIYITTDGLKELIKIFME